MFFVYYAPTNIGLQRCQLSKPCCKTPFLQRVCIVLQKEHCIVGTCIKHQKIFYNRLKITIHVVL